MKNKRSDTKKYLLRTLVFFLGAIFGLLVIELGLRAFSSAQRNTQPIVGGSFRVLCLGGSHTQGLGIEPKRAYCNQLQERLTATGISDPNTFNLGEGGMNSHQILERLPKLLKKYRPQLVVAMIGEPNEWNHKGLDEFLSLEEKAAPPSALVSFIHNLRILRAIRLFDAHQTEAKFDPYELEISQLLPMLGQHHSQGRAEALENLFRQAGGKGPRAVTAATQLSILHHFSHNHSKSLAWAKAGFEAQPGTFNLSLMKAIEAISSPRLPPNLDRKQNKLLRWLHASLSREKLPPLAVRALLENDSRGAVTECLRDKICRAHIIRVAELDPENAWLRSILYGEFFASADYNALTRLISGSLRWNPVHFYETPIFHASRLRSELKRAGNQQKNLSLLQEAIDASARDFPFVPSRIERKTDEAMISRWLAHDLAKIQKMLDEQGVMVVFQTLPPRRKANLARRRTDQVILEYCRQASCHLSDTWQAFQHLAGKLPSVDQNEVFSTEYGPTDEHLNEFGHSLVADQLLRDILPLLK